MYTRLASYYFNVGTFQQKELIQIQNLITLTQKGLYIVAYVLGTYLVVLCYAFT